jgi:membrane fusion protein, peptide pheromone/bacteriocin exporter
LATSVDMDNIPAKILPGTIEYYLFRISKKSQVIYLALAAMVLIALLALPFVYVVVSVSAPGFITTQYEHQSLFAPASGKVLFSGIRSNKRVSRGDTLLIIDTNVSSAHLGSLNIKKEENNQSIHDLLMLVKLDSVTLVNGHPSLITSRYRADFESFQKRYLHQSILVNKRIRDHQRVKHLFNQEVVSGLEYDTSLFELEQELTTLGLFFRQQVNSWQNDLTSRLAQQAAIDAEIKNLIEEINKRFLVSPFDGTILISTDIQEGTFLVANQRLGELSPDGELIISAMVPPINSGYLYESQKVKVQVDAYNYNQWGMLEAFVMDISGDILFDPSGNFPYYRVRCQVLTDSLVHRNGSIALIKKGMTVNCRFIQSRESLFTLLVKRADNWLNPSVKNQQ